MNNQIYLLSGYRYGNESRKWAILLMKYLEQCLDSEIMSKSTKTVREDRITFKCTRSKMCATNDLQNPVQRKMIMIP